MLIPWWMKIYTILFIVVVISNLIFQFKLKVRKPILFYEFTSASYMVFLIYAYWTPSVLATIHILNIIPLILIICIDFYLTIWGKEEDLGIKMPEMSHKELEAAKAISIIFASPAYITGLMLALQVIG